MSSGFARIVISWDCVVAIESFRSVSMSFTGTGTVLSEVFEVWRECREMLDVVEASEESDGVSLSDAELSSRCSSGIDSTVKF